jgi:histidine triad (HIT) family protein
MATIFSRIVSGEIPSYKITEDENFFAFLDISPLAKGHVLVIPKKEVDYLFDLDDTLYSGIFSFAKKIAIALKKAFPCEKVGVAVIGLEVLHAHIHLIPLQTMSDIDFRKPKLKLSPEELSEVRDKIIREL